MHRSFFAFNAYLLPVTSKCFIIVKKEDSFERMQPKHRTKYARIQVFTDPYSRVFSHILCSEICSFFSIRIPQILMLEVRPMH